MKVLAIDLSLHAGWALLEGEPGQQPKLISCGAIHLGQPVLSFGSGKYPFSYLEATRAQVKQVLDQTYWNFNPDVVVVEETNGGKNRYSQKVLEWLHLNLVSKFTTDQIGGPLVYIDSSEWRSILGLKMTKDQKRANAKLSKAKRKAADTGTKLDKKKLGIRGRVTVKHLAVAKANEMYGLKLKVKDNDVADALGLGTAFFLNARHCDGV